ncbi:RAD55 family ATPase [Chitinivibrio alkaliphilus]|uniref:ATPase n=1 Tax=Chitinivibrio alkaliphilus ACht1 TaxID=1313304 RepID=U7D6C9_9BACT|nr:ATPase domain-containing protein [Chitinivibrio alkaliphilus]ERP31493.1 ATPase [Chitinivibrio alkaliphilus ACht1]
MSSHRAKTGIQAFDNMISGGLIAGSANLIEGAPGTGKTTLAMQFIYNGIVKYNEPGLIITFEEFPQQFYHDALELGWDLRALEKEGMLRVIFSDPETTLHEIENPEGDFVSLIEEYDVKRVAIDSMTHFEYLTRDHYEVRDIERRFINALKREGVTSVLLKENDALLGQVPNSITSKTPFVVDTYILLRYVEVESAIRKALLILKMRGSQHDKDIRQYAITPTGIEVEETFEGHEGIMSGITHRKPQEAFMNVFGKK